MRIRLLRPLGLALSVTLAAAGAGAADAPWLADARQVAGAVPPRLIGVLRQAIDERGPVEALAVCREQAPALARAASAQSGWQIRRVSTGPRNPKAVPDDWEAGVLADFERRLAAGESAVGLDHHETVLQDGQRWQRYMLALPTQAFCTQCHGTADQLAPGVAARLRELYPADRATGYAVGQLRGALTIRRPAP